MSTPKGWPSQEKEDRLKAEHVTVEPIREMQHGLSVLAHAWVYQVGTDAVEANSTTTTIVATAHAAIKGDVIQFTSGVHANKDVKVFSVSTNAIVLAEELSVAPSAADAFRIMRHKYPTVDSAGGISTSSGPLQFVLDGANQQVVEDTVTPANNHPLPVKLTGFTGDITITAQELNVSLSHANDSVKIGDGSETANVTALNQLEVAVTAALPAGTNNIGDVDVLSLPSIPAGTNNIGDVDVLSLPSIPAGANLIGSVDVNSLPSIPAGTNNIGDVDVLSLPSIPAGANLIGSVDVNSLPSIPAGTNNIGDVDVLTLPSIPAGTNNIGDVDVLTLPAIPTGTNSIGSVTLNGQDVVDFMDAPLLDTSSTNIPASASNPVQVVASLAANVKKIKVSDTTGFYVGVYSGAALSEVLQCISGPGEDGIIDVTLSSGDRISLRAMQNSAITSGLYVVQFIG